MHVFWKSIDIYHNLHNVVSASGRVLRISDPSDRLWVPTSGHADTHQPVRDMTGQVWVRERELVWWIFGSQVLDLTAEDGAVATSDEAVVLW